MTSLNQIDVAGGNTVAPKTVTFDYNLASQITNTRRHNSALADSLVVHSRNTFDGAGRLASITHATAEIAPGEAWGGTSAIPASLSAGELVAGYTFSYDTNDRLKNLRSYSDGFRNVFTYAARDEVIKKQSFAIAGLGATFVPAVEDFGYDLAGNRTNDTGNPPSAAGSHNQIQDDGVYSYVYDNEGNLTEKTTLATGEVQQYDWDHRNRLTSVTSLASAGGSTTQVVNYQYDAFDRRILKEVDTDGDGDIDRSEYFVWNGDHTSIRLQDSDGDGTAEGIRITNR